MAEVAEFGIVPTAGTAAFGGAHNHNHGFGNGFGNNNGNNNNNNGGVSGYESERDTRMTGSSRGSARTSVGSLDPNGNPIVPPPVPIVGGNAVHRAARVARRGSILVGTAVNNVTTTVTTTVAAGANAVTDTLALSLRLAAGTNNIYNNNMMNGAAGASMLEVATDEEMYNKLREQNNAELDKVLELKRQADEYDPYQYDSDTDVANIHKKKRKKYVILEKHLKKPMTQEIGNNNNNAGNNNIAVASAVDMSLAKALQKARRQVNAIFYHMFDDPLYKIDKNLFPTKLDANAEKELINKIKKKKRGLFYNRRQSAEELKEEEEREKRLKMTPYEKRQQEMDKVLMINHYSHSNPWINRVAIVMQPLLEMSQTFLFASRATFNIFTWRDPVLCFWLCFLGPFVAFVLYVAPYRLFSFVIGIYVIGPQNYVLRLYRENRPGYEPPDFDLIVKKKKIEKVEDFQEMQFFSSEAPGNQQIRFRNIDPTQVKQIVVPSNVLLYNRFYDWPPEPEYARVYASAAPKNLSTPGFADDSDNNNNEDGQGHGYESDSAYIFDQAARNKPEVKKKKKKGFRKVTSKIKKGTRASIGFVENSANTVFTGTEQVFGATTDATFGAVKGTANMTKNAVKGTSKQAKSAAKGTGNFLRLRRRNKPRGSREPKYSEEDEEYYGE